MVKAPLLLVLVSSTLLSGVTGCQTARTEEVTFVEYCRSAPIVQDQFGVMALPEPSPEVRHACQSVAATNPEKCLEELTILMLRRLRRDIQHHHTGRFLPEDNLFVQQFYRLSSAIPFEGGPLSSDVLAWVKSGAPFNIADHPQVRRLVKEIESELSEYRPEKNSN